MKRRSLIAGAVAAVPAASSLAALKCEPAGPQYTFVLQHGAWHGGWCWVRVAERLRAEGHRVFTPTSTGLGERSHLLSKDTTVEVLVKDLTQMLEAEELEDVVLVGHSFGGIAISGAADRAARRLRRLVYLDAVILQPGQSALSSVPPEVAAQRREAIRAAGGIALAVPPTEFFGIAQGPDADWLRRRLTPHPAATYDSPLDIRNPVGNGLPTTYIGCTVNPLASIEPMRQWARDQAAQTGSNWRYEELQAVHNAMMSAPDTLVRMLLRIAVA
jgi:pimeloyl-ACP methyl ester carboxylesterase